MTRSRQTADWGSRAGLAKIVPSSVVVGSGTGSADSLGNVTFSGCSNIVLNYVFSANYENYRFNLYITDLTTDFNIYLKLRSGTTDNSTNYYSMYYGIRSDSPNFSQAENAITSGLFLTSGDAGTDNIYGFTGDILKPFLNINTKIAGISHNSTSIGTPASLSGAGLHFVAASYTNINLIPSAGNITGSIKIYGYN